MTDDRPLEITTCLLSLLDGLHCCMEGCAAQPTSAVLTDDLVEHIRCTEHDHGPDVEAVKRLQFVPVWEPRSAL